MLRLFIKPGIQERGTECEKHGECSLGFWGMLLSYYSRECWRRFRGTFPKILGNFWKDSRDCSQKFRGNARKDSGECSRGFRRIFENISGNVAEDSGECSRGFRGMFNKVPGNVRENSRESKFRFILWNLAYFFIKSCN